MTASIIHFTHSPDGSVPEPSPLVEVEEFDIELPLDDDLLFHTPLDLRVWLKTSDHRDAVNFRGMYGDPDTFGFIGVFSKWRGTYDFVDPNWEKHSRPSL